MGAAFGGHTLTERRYEQLIVVRRVNGASRGWSCSHHFQPMALPPGVTLMRSLLAQELERAAHATP